MAEIIPFPRRAEPSPEYTAAELEDVRLCVGRMMAQGHIEEFAFEVAAVRWRTMKGVCHGD